LRKPVEKGRRKKQVNCDEVGEAKGKIIEIAKSPLASSAAESSKRVSYITVARIREHSNVRAAS